MRRGEYEEIEKETQKIYAGVEVRETEEGAEDEKGEKNNQTNKQTNTTGTTIGKGHITGVWKKKECVVDG